LAPIDAEASLALSGAVQIDGDLSELQTAAETIRGLIGEGFFGSPVSDGYGAYASRTDEGSRA
jgi:hypothetical protein